MDNTTEDSSTSDNQSNLSFAQRHAQELRQNDTPEERVTHELEKWKQAHRTNPSEGQIMRKRDELMVEARLIPDRLAISSPLSIQDQNFKKGPSDQDIAAQNLEKMRRLYYNGELPEEKRVREAEEKRRLEEDRQRRLATLHLVKPTEPPSPFPVVRPIRQGVKPQLQTEDQVAAATSRNKEDLEHSA